MITEEKLYWWTFKQELDGEMWIGGWYTIGNPDTAFNYAEITAKATPRPEEMSGKKWDRLLKKGRARLDDDGWDLLEKNSRLLERTNEPSHNHLP